VRGGAVEGGGEAAGSKRKTRTPHNDVGKKTSSCFQVAGKWPLTTSIKQTS